MGRLTTFSKLLITLIILALLFFGYRYIAESFNLPQIGPADDDTREVVIGKDEAGEEITIEIPPKSETVEKTAGNWDYIPESPIGGKLKGVVELGASGFNSFIIRTDQDKNWKLERAEWSNSLVYEGMASGTDVTQGLKQYIAKFLDYGVAGNEIHFVVSSGALKNDKTKTITSALKNLGFVVNEVTPEQEGGYALKSVLPKVYENNAFVVDIGSGNTKVSWMVGGKVQAKETYGSKYFQNGVSDAKVYADAKRVGELIPENRTGTCFIIGGVPFNLAKEGRAGKERYTVLGDPGSYESDEAKTKAGLNIYQGIKDGTGCDQYVFDWEANFTIGFLLTLPY
ncbi:hypothetical protein [Portibacter marinus]|uniref:hypothetical protein n=1 Tax=Portibacter marinus TaxID=2898660 RepID=UPI001F1A7BA7|nr:hypothetical protein [Portibacter marinus]